MQKGAKIISFILQPLFMPLFGLMLLMQTDLFAHTPFLYKLYLWFGTLLFTIGLPTAAIVVLTALGKVTSYFIDNRRERTLPYALTVIFYVFYIYFLLNSYIPVWIVGMMAGSVIAIMMIALINTKWKISAHLTGMGALTMAVFIVSYRLIINPVPLFIIMIILSALVASSRMILKAHTPMQVLCGFLAGAVCVMFPGMVL